MGRRKSRTAKYITKGIRVAGAGAAGAAIGSIEEALGEDAANKAEWGFTIVGTLMSIFGTGNMEDVGEVLAESGASLKGYEAGKNLTKKVKTKIDAAAVERTAEIKAAERKELLAELRALGNARPGMDETVEPGPFTIPKPTAKQNSKKGRAAAEAEAADE